MENAQTAQPRLTFIGSGRMAGAMVRGILAKHVVAAENICCTGAPDGTAEALAAETGIRCAYDSETLMAGADWIVLACKPQQLNAISQEIRNLAKEKVILSILAGTPLKKLQSVFPSAQNWLRAMPNTPGQIGAGISAFASALPLTPEHRQTAFAVLHALGEVIEIEEIHLDAVTAVSGSGPAYVFEFVAALRDAAIAADLPAPTAYQLALHTVLGAAKLLQHSPATPEQQREWVSSPGGTTLAGLAILEQRHFRQTLIETVQAAKARSIELAN